MGIRCPAFLELFFCGFGEETVDKGAETGIILSCHDIGKAERDFVTKTPNFFLFFRKKQEMKLDGICDILKNKTGAEKGKTTWSTDLSLFQRCAGHFVKDSSRLKIGGDNI